MGARKEKNPKKKRGEVANQERISVIGEKTDVREKGGVQEHGAPQTISLHKRKGPRNKKKKKAGGPFWAGGRGGDCA